MFAKTLIVSIVCSLFVLVSPAFVGAQQGAACLCPREESSIVDDSECRSCTQGASCPNKRCSVLVETPGSPTVARKIACYWDPQNEFCVTGCQPRPGWMTVIECPTEADVGTCVSHQCIMIKIGYSGPLTATLPSGARNPNVALADCKKR